MKFRIENVAIPVSVSCLISFFSYEDRVSMFIARAILMPDKNS